MSEINYCTAKATEFFVRGQLGSLINSKNAKFDEFSSYIFVKELSYENIGKKIFFAFLLLIFNPNFI